MAESSMPAGAPAPADFTLRVSAGLLAVVLGVAAFLMRDALNPRIQAVLGIIAFISVVAAFSSNLRAVSWRTSSCLAAARRSWSGLHGFIR